MIPDNLGDDATISSNKHQEIISILSYAKVSAISLRTLSTLSSGGYVTRIIKHKHTKEGNEYSWSKTCSLSKRLMLNIFLFISKGVKLLTRDSP